MSSQLNFFEAFLKKITILFSIVFLSACLDSGSDDGPDGSGGPGPDPDPEEPADLGLVSTLDTAWATLSYSPFMSKVVFNGTKYTGVGSSGYIADSTDGITWTQHDTGSAISFKDIAVAGDAAVAVPGDDRYYPGEHVDQTDNFIGLAYTTNGTSWQLADRASETQCVQISSVTHDGTQFVGVFDSASICTSTDGNAWTLRATHNGQSFTGIVAGNNAYVLSIADGIVVVTDLDNTASSVPATNGALKDLIFADSKFVAINASSAVITSTDGVTWVDATGAVIPAGALRVSYSAGKEFTVYASGEVLFTSPDAVTWTEVAGAPYPNAISKILANGTNESLIVLDGTILRSTDNATWTDVSPVMPAGQIQAYLKHDGTVYAGGYSKVGAADWVAINNPSGIGSITGLIHDGSTIMASANNAAGTGGIATFDGTDWTTQFSYTSNSQVDVSAELAGTTYYFGGLGQALKSTDDGESFSIESAPTPGGQSGATKPYLQAVSNDTTLVVTTVMNDVFSLTGTTWNEALRYGSVDSNNQIITPYSISDVVWSGSKFVMVGANGFVRTSADGITWENGTWGSAAAITDVLAVGSTLYAVDNTGKLKSSSDDGATWTEIESFTQAVDQLVYNTATSTFYGFGRNSAGNGGYVYSTTATDAATGWGAPDATADANVGASHITYDATSSKFVSLTQNGTGFNSSADGITWAYGSTVPTDSAYAFLAAKTSLSGIADGLFKGLTYDGTTYRAGAAFSTNGTDWFIGSGASASDLAGVDGETTELYKEVSSSSYILLTKSEVNGVTIRKIYTSTDGNWGNAVAEISGPTNGTPEAVQTVVDIEFDGTNYLVLMNDLYNEPASALPAAKGNYILKIVDTDTVSLLELGIRPALQDLIIEADGSYTVIGDDGAIATRVAY